MSKVNVLLEAILSTEGSLLFESLESSIRTVFSSVPLGFVTASEREPLEPRRVKGVVLNCRPVVSTRKKQTKQKRFKSTVPGTDVSNSSRFRTSDGIKNKPAVVSKASFFSIDNFYVNLFFFGRGGRELFICFVSIFFFFTFMNLNNTMDVFQLFFPILTSSPLHLI